MSNWIDVIEDIENNPDAGLILSSFTGMWILLPSLSDTTPFDMTILFRCLQIIRTDLGNPGGERAVPQEESRCSPTMNTKPTRTRSMYQNVVWNPMALIFFANDKFIIIIMCNRGLSIAFRLWARVLCKMTLVHERD